MSRAVPVPVVEYAQILRRSTEWFALRATRQGEGYRPDPQGETLMYFPTEECLLARTLKSHGRRRRAIRIEAAKLEPQRHQWLKEHSLEDAA